MRTDEQKRVAREKRTSTRKEAHDTSAFLTEERAVMTTTTPFVEVHLFVDY